MASKNIFPVQEEEEPVVCLLGRLKCPIESDLARKRKIYRPIQLRESRELKVPLLLSHRKLLSPLDKESPD